MNPQLVNPLEMLFEKVVKTMRMQMRTLIPKMRNRPPQEAVRMLCMMNLKMTMRSQQRRQRVTIQQATTKNQARPHATDSRGDNRQDRVFENKIQLIPK